MFMFEKPHGMRDTLPGLYETKKKVRRSLTDLIDKWGYQFMETPTLEFYDTVGVQSAIEEQQLFKLLDQDGKTLVLRPDMTGPIARVAASKLACSIGFSVFIAIRIIEIHIFIIISRNGDAVFAVRNFYRSVWRFPCLHVVNWRKVGCRNNPNWIAFFKLLINSGNTFSSQIRHFVSRIGFRQLIDRSMVDTETRAIRHIPDKSVIRITL